MKESKIAMTSVLPHGSYLVNLGSPDSELQKKSRDCFLEELLRCESLGVSKHNIHPGSNKGESTKDAIERIADAINWAHKATKSVIVVLENTAGAGNTLGRTFQELKEIIDRVDNKSRVGVCLDTCHMFAAGYDIRLPSGYAKVMDEFDKTIGFSNLQGVHINDSKAQLGSRKDRHEKLGRGYLGLTPFWCLMRDQRLNHVPFILETPEEDEYNYQDEIALLRTLEAMDEATFDKFLASSSSSSRDKTNTNKSK